MQQPESYNDKIGRVCKLSKSLYSLKQSPRCWNKRLVSFIEKQGLIVSKADPCMFYRTCKGVKLIILIYVDDGLVAGECDSRAHEFIRSMEKEFHVKKINPDTFLGLSIKLNDD